MAFSNLKQSKHLVSSNALYYIFIWAKVKNKYIVPQEIPTGYETRRLIKLILILGQSSSLVQFFSHQ